MTEPGCRPTEEELRRNERVYRKLKPQLLPAERHDLFQQARIHDYPAFERALLALADRYGIGTNLNYRLGRRRPAFTPMKRRRGRPRKQDPDGHGGTAQARKEEKDENPGGIT